MILLPGQPALSRLRGLRATSPVALERQQSESLDAWEKEVKEDRDAVAPWLPIDSAWWPNIAIEMPKPWPRSAVLMDLRWWSDQERMGRKKRPGRPALCRRWGWTDWQARATMKDEASWKDRLQPASNSHPTPIQNGTPKPPKSQEATSSSPPAHIQPASTCADLHNNTTTQQHNSSKEDTSVSDLWKEINEARKDAGSARALKLTAKRRRALGARLKEHTTDDMMRVVDWWIHSDHHRATWLRDGGYSIDTILRHFDEYLDLSHQDAKRTHDHGKSKREPTMSDLLAERRARRDQLNVVVFPLTPSQGTTNGD